MADLYSSLKASIKRAFAVAGFEVYRRDTVRLTQAAVLQHCARLGFQPASVIDVGVGFGTLELYQAFPYARHLLIEPLREFEPALRRLQRTYGAEYVLAAAGPRSGSVTINVHTVLEHSTIYSDSAFDEAAETQRTVPVIELDDVCHERGLVGPFVVKADVQGAELKVLDGASRVLKDTELVLIEVSMFEFFKGAPEFHDVVQYMKQRGFVVYDIGGRFNRPLDGALAQVDLAFVREGGMFRQERDAITNQQRGIFERRALAIQRRQESAVRRRSTL